MPFDPAVFKDVASGIQSLFIVVAIIVGGGWTLITLRAFQQVRKAEADLREVELNITQQAVLNLTLDVFQTSIRDDPSYYLSVELKCHNAGNRIGSLAFPDAEPLTVAPITIDEDGRSFVGEEVQVSSYRTNGQVASSVSLQPGETHQVPFFCAFETSRWLFDSIPNRCEST